MKFDLSVFSRDPALVAQSVGAQEVFSFLARTITLPHGCAVMAWATAGPSRVIPQGMSLEGEGISRLLFVRTSSFTLDYAFPKLNSQDGYEISARVACGMQVVVERAELAAFCDRVLGSAASVTLDRLRQYCEEAVYAAAESFAKARPAAELLTPRAWAEFDAHLAEYFKPLGFASGLALADDTRITIDSADFARAADARRTQQLREQRIAEERRLRDMATDARRQHLAELAGTLDKLRDMAGKEKETTLPDLIRALDPSQRGGLYHALLAHQPGRRSAASLLIVAGDELIWIDPASPDKPARRLSLTSEIGPLRSVRTAMWESRPVILVGARSGVHVLQTEQDPRQVFAFDAGRELRGGVNAAAIIGEDLFATHSEVGLIHWRLRRPESFELICAKTLNGRKSVRDVQSDDAGKLWLAADRQVICVTPAGKAQPFPAGHALGAEPPSLPPQNAAHSETILEAPAVITTLTVAGGRILAGMENGQIASWQADAALRESIRPATGQAVESITWLEGGGVPRLLVADRRPYVDMMVLGDVSSTKYTTNQPIRWALPAGDWIVGVNDRRDQLVIWRIEDPAEPASVISIGQLCGRSVQDIAIACGAA
ncbi:MAG: hypothetical protein DCC65_04115 [Planctomycetota bacterium]|nr:MAG: hypothetical protein DCC65_04115 [Planctomycetota bacterium]